MPTLISHQAPGLTLKIKFPNKFDGTALCISAFIPDLNFIFMFFFPSIHRKITHGLLGITLFTIPLTLIFTIIFCKYFGPICANLAKKNGIISKPLKYFGIDEWDNLKKNTKGDFLLWHLIQHLLEDFHIYYLISSHIEI